MGNLYCHIVLGFGVLFLGLGVADGIRMVLTPRIRLLREISTIERRRAARPILLPEWNLPKV